MIRESSSEVIQLPMPYELPPQPYGPQGQAMPNSFMVAMQLLCILHILTLFSSHQMYLGLGIVGILKKMSMVRFGHVKFSFMLPRILDTPSPPLKYLLNFIDFTGSRAWVPLQAIVLPTVNLLHELFNITLRKGWESWQQEFIIRPSAS